MPPQCPALAKVKGAGEVPLCVLVAKTTTPGDQKLRIKVKPNAQYVLIAQVAWW
jgi:hypothetical protein